LANLPVFASTVVSSAESDTKVEIQLLYKEKICKSSIYSSSRNGWGF